MGRKSMINVRLSDDTHDEFKTVSFIRGASMSTLLHQFIVSSIREEKDRSAREFEEARLKVKEESTKAQNNNLPHEQAERDHHPKKVDINKPLPTTQTAANQTATPPTDYKETSKISPDSARVGLIDNMRDSRAAKRRETVPTNKGKNE